MCFCVLLIFSSIWRDCAGVWSTNFFFNSISVESNENICDFHLIFKVIFISLCYSFPTHRLLKITLNGKKLIQLQCFRELITMSERARGWWVSWDYLNWIGRLKVKKSFDFALVPFATVFGERKYTKRNKKRALSYLFTWSSFKYAEEISKTS